MLNMEKNYMSVTKMICIYLQSSLVTEWYWVSKKWIVKDVILLMPCRGGRSYFHLLRCGEVLKPHADVLKVWRVSCVEAEKQAWVLPSRGYPRQLLGCTVGAEGRGTQTVHVAPFPFLYAPRFLGTR